MRFADAIKQCFAKYAEFDGRAKRPEFWWFMLFVILVSLALDQISGIVSLLFSLATLLPSVAVGTRRLHDTNRSGWWQLLWLIPVLGWIALIMFLAQEGEAADNRFGAPPAI